MALQRRVTVTMQCKNGRILHLRKSTRAEGMLRTIYTILGIKSSPGNVQKT